MTTLYSVFKEQKASGKTIKKLCLLALFYLNHLPFRTTFNYIIKRSLCQGSFLSFCPDNQLSVNVCFSLLTIATRHKYSTEVLFCQGCFSVLFTIIYCSPSGRRKYTAKAGNIRYSRVRITYITAFRSQIFHIPWLFRW